MCQPSQRHMFYANIFVKTKKFACSYGARSNLLSNKVVKNLVTLSFKLLCWCTLFQVLSLREFVGAPCSKFFLSESLLVHPVPSSFSRRVCWCTLFLVLSLGEFVCAPCSKFFLSESRLVHPVPSSFSQRVMSRHPVPSSTH